MNVPRPLRDRSGANEMQGREAAVENRSKRRRVRQSRTDRDEPIGRNSLMKRLITLFAMLSVVVVAVAFAKGGDEKAAGKTEGHSHSMAAAKTGSWTGEIVDAGCYLGHGAMGAKHTECAAKCAANGMPLMLLTKDGKAILLTMPHDNVDAYNQVKEMAGTMASSEPSATGVARFSRNRTSSPSK